MSELDERISRLEPAHQRALAWFWSRRGEEIAWPQPLEDGLFLMNKAKGMHKPKGWRHVLSVRESLSGPYADREPVERPDGSWTYDYFQEGADPARRDRDFTNRGLLACADEGVPIAVLRQIRGKPNSRYKVLGLATVGGWRDGYFTLEGFAPSGALGSLVITQGMVLPSAPAPMSLDDARRRIETSIVQRQGGAAFRAKVMAAYDGRCALSDCDAAEALEAAHIVPYLGPQTDLAENGLLLRADLHTLFDRQLLDIDPLNLRVELAPALRKTVYASFDGKPLRLPRGVEIADLCRMLTTRRTVLAGVLPS